MFGQNPIRKLDQTPDDGKLAVQEIFYTIQGEGPFSGQPAVFVRLAGCHLACTFCDTEFESGINNRLTPDEVCHSVRMAMAGCPVPLVVLTGGEPLRQAAGSLCAALVHSASCSHVQIETAGNLWDPALVPLLEAGCVSLVCSPKTPHVHPMVARYCRHWKYVVRAGDSHGVDGLPARSTQMHQRDDLRLFRPWDLSDWDSSSATIWVSPCDEHDDQHNASNSKHAVQVAMRHGYRLSLQTHKILGLA